MANLSSMHILRMREAAYARRGETICAPVSLDLAAAEQQTMRCATARQAEALALMACALVRASAGTVTIGEFDARVQPAQCKRLTGFVPHDPLPLSHLDADRYIAYRAALWNIDTDHARERAAALLEHLRGIHEAFAYPLVAALLPAPKLLVLDRPQSEWLPQMLAAAGDCAVLVTRNEAAA
jgi:hypothetical protein